MHAHWSLCHLLLAENEDPCCSPRCYLFDVSIYKILHSASCWTSSTIAYTLKKIRTSHHGFHHGLSSSHVYTVILVLVDWLTKTVHFGPMATNFTASKTVTLFADIVVKLHGVLASILSDCDPAFISSFRQDLFKLCGTRLHHNFTFHPQTDGQIKVVNRILEQYLSALTHEKPNAWLYLGWDEFSYNTSY